MTPIFKNNKGIGKLKDNLTGSLFPKNVTKLVYIQSIKMI